MDKNVISFVIEATSAGLDTVDKSIKTVTTSISGMAEVTKRAEGWFGKLKFALGTVFGPLGVLAQILSGVCALWQMFKERADKAAEAAKEAAKKTREAWKNAKDAVLNYRREAYLKDKSTVDLRALDESIARHAPPLSAMVQSGTAPGSSADMAAADAVLRHALGRHEQVEVQLTAPVRIPYTAGSGKKCRKNQVQGGDSERPEEHREAIRQWHIRGLEYVEKIRLRIPPLYVFLYQQSDFLTYGTEYEDNDCGRLIFDERFIEEDDK